MEVLFLNLDFSVLLRLMYVGEVFRLLAVKHWEFAGALGEFVSVYRRDGKPVPYLHTRHIFKSARVYYLEIAGIGAIGVVWGQFGVVHILTLLAAAGIVAGLYFILKQASGRTQDLVLGVLSFSGIVAVIYNYIVNGSLPLQLCSLNALLLPVLVFTKSHVIGNLLMVWGLGAAMALVYNVNVAAAPIFSAAFNAYYFPHVMECGIPWLMFLLGKVKKKPKHILTTAGITVAVYTLVHFINLALDTNYMYSMGPTTPLAQILWNLLPCRYWYMYLLIPIVAVFLLAVYAPELKSARRKK